MTPEQKPVRGKQRAQPRPFRNKTVPELFVRGKQEALRKQRQMTALVLPAPPPAKRTTWYRLQNKEMYDLQLKAQEMGTQKGSTSPWSGVTLCARGPWRGPNTTTTPTCSLGRRTFQKRTRTWMLNVRRKRLSSHLIWAKILSWH